MQMNRRVACLGLLGLFSLANPWFGVRGDQSPSRTEAADKWIRENYATIQHRVFPKQLELVPFPRGTKWVSVVLIEEPFMRSEFWFSVSREYSGAVRAKVRIAHGGSLAQQIGELKAANPAATAETISKSVRVDDYEITDMQAPRLKNLADALERDTIPAITPDLMGLDLPAYHYWTESQYGQQMSAQLVGYGRDSRSQPHSLVQWAEQVRALTTSYIGGKH